MIFACSLCIFDVISSVGGSHISILPWLLVHAVTIGSMFIYKFSGHLTEG